MLFLSAAALFAASSAFPDQKFDGFLTNIFTENYAESVTSAAEPWDIVLPNTLAIDENRVLNTLKILTGVIPVNGTTDKIVNRSLSQYKQITQNYLMRELTALGLAPEKKCYTTARSSGCNIEATLWGNNRTDAIYFTAHYDSVTTSAADDNGSGVAAVMEIATLLSTHKTNKTVRFVFFDGEELGLQGSKAYASKINANTEAIPKAVFVLDTMGYDSDNDGAIHIVDCNRADSTPLTQAIMKTVGLLNTNLTQSETCTTRSDHSSFWNNNIGAVIVAENFFGGDSNNCYHKSCDTISNMNLNYYYRIVTTMANVAAGMSEIIN